MEFLTKNKKKTLRDFVLFVSKELQIKHIPEIRIQNHRNGLKTTANYDYTKDEKIIKICGKNRALIDIMRSIAHELVHHKQYEQGRLKIKPPDIGGEIEDEANAKAGQFIKMFSKVNDKIYDEDIDEQVETPSEITNTTTTPTSDNTGYPAVGKWESGVTRGVANQIGNTKWSDIIQINRGKANQLK